MDAARFILPRGTIFLPSLFQMPRLTSGAIDVTKEQCVVGYFGGYCYRVGFILLLLLLERKETGQIRSNATGQETGEPSSTDGDHGGRSGPVFPYWKYARSRGHQRRSDRSAGRVRRRRSSIWRRLVCARQHCSSQSIKSDKPLRFVIAVFRKSTNCVLFLTSSICAHVRMLFLSFQMAAATDTKASNPDVGTW